MSVGPFEHDGEVVLDHACGHLHGVFGEGSFDDVEALACNEVVHAHCGLAVQRRIALGEIVAAIMDVSVVQVEQDRFCAQFFEQFHRSIEGFRGRSTALVSALFDSPGFVFVVSRVVVVKLWWLS